MNFLAHFHLAWPNTGLIVGALEGEYYRGALDPSLDTELARGIALHRAIDAFTDRHPAVVELRRQFPGPLRRFAGIVIDLGFDHCLSTHWPSVSQHTLSAFNEKILAILHAHEHALSARSLAMLGGLQQHQLLMRYDEWDMVAASAERVGARFTRGNPLQNIGHALTPLRPHFHDTFARFYPELQQFVASREPALAAHNPS